MEKKTLIISASFKTFIQAPGIWVDNGQSHLGACNPKPFYFVSPTNIAANHKIESRTFKNLPFVLTNVNQNRQVLSYI